MIFSVTQLEQQCRCVSIQTHESSTLLVGNYVSAVQTLVRELNCHDFKGGFSRHLLSKAEVCEKMQLLSAGFCFCSVYHRRSNALRSPIRLLYQNIRPLADGQ